jgi:peptidoglycan/LPS O-acetylase OafA/YrhL
LNPWISNPLLAIAVYAMAIATAATLLRVFPRIRASLVSTGNQRFASIDGLRGYLALGVFIHHAVITWIALNTGVTDVPANTFYAQIGLASVALFFMITGFLFWGRLLKQGQAHDWLAFAVSRVFRIYPLYLLLLAVVVLSVFHVQGWALVETPAALIKQIAMWLTFDRPDINGYPQTGGMIANVTWTLSYELFFYLSLPFFGALFIYRGRWQKTVLAILAIVLLYKLVGWEHSLRKHILMAFLGGIAAAYWVRRPALVAWGQTRLAAVIALLVLAVTMTFFRKSFAIAPVLLLTLFFAVVASGNTLFGALKLASVRWLGEVSYSTYLLHGFLLWLATRQLPELLHIDMRGPVPYLTMLAVSTVLLVIISTLSFSYIEKPGIEAGKQLLLRLRSRKRALV